MGSLNFFFLISESHNGFESYCDYVGELLHLDFSTFLEKKNDMVPKSHAREHVHFGAERSILSEILSYYLGHSSLIKAQLIDLLNSPKQINS